MFHVGLDGSQKRLILQIPGAPSKIDVFPSEKHNFDISSDFRWLRINEFVYSVVMVMVSLSVSVASLSFEICIFFLLMTFASHSLLPPMEVWLSRLLNVNHDATRWYSARSSNIY